MLIDNLKEKNVILASRSPRRKQLLTALGLEFRIVEPVISEIYPPGLKREEIAKYLAEMKADWTSSNECLSEDAIIISSDTIVCLNDLILNKPETRTEAMDMIRKLSGNCHSVITAVCIKYKSRKKTFHSETKVYFTKLQEEEIEYYIDNYKPYDKAGSYGIQEWIGFIGIEKIEGSYFNVMGLPVQKLYSELKNIL